MILLLMYLIIGAVVCGANYFVMQQGKEDQQYFDELNCTLGSIIIGIFWPFCIGVVAARVYQHIQKHK